MSLRLQRSRGAEQILLSGSYQRISPGKGLTEIEVEGPAGNESADAARRIDVEDIAARNRPTGIDLTIVDERVAAFWQRIGGIHLIENGRTGILSDIDHDCFPARVG